MSKAIPKSLLAKDFYKVASTRSERGECYHFQFGLPPLHPGGKERGSICLPLPKEKVTDYCIFYFGREPILETRRILIKHKKEVYVERLPAYPAPVNSVWIARIEVSPLLFEEC